MRRIKLAPAHLSPSLYCRSLRNNLFPNACPGTYAMYLMNELNSFFCLTQLEVASKLLSSLHTFFPHHQSLILPWSNPALLLFYCT